MFLGRKKRKKPELKMVHIDFLYHDYVPTWNAELQKRLMYEEEPTQGQNSCTISTKIILFQDEPINEGFCFEKEEGNEEIVDLYDIYDEEDHVAWSSKSHHLFRNRESYALQRRKRSTKKLRINPDRWASVWQRKREELRQICIAQNQSVSTVYTAPITPSFTVSPEQSHIPLEPVHKTSVEHVGNYIHDEELELQMALEKSAKEVAPCGLSYQIIQELMNRDLTAEDYLLLLELDESIAPKTLASAVVESYPLHVVEEDDLHLNENCPICMSPYEVGQLLKTIPACGHQFHDDCISYWLKDRSTMCPLDNISLKT